MSDKTIKTEKTHTVRIYMSGPIDVAKQVLRRECMVSGLCVTVTPTCFVYAGGEETGFEVGLLNYPKFPCAPSELEKRAMSIAEKLLRDTYQRSALIVTPQSATWINHG